VCFMSNGQVLTINIIFVQDRFTDLYRSLRGSRFLFFLLCSLKCENCWVVVEFSMWETGKKSAGCIKQNKTLALPFHYT
jgi:hypothetical protein